MNLSPNITVYPGTDRQIAVGIMGRAVIHLNVGDETIATFNSIMIRKSKAGNWWIQWPAEEDRTGAKNDAGYVKTYSYYRILPGEGNKDKRIALEKAIINKLQSDTGGTTTPKADQALQAPAPPATTADKGSGEFVFNLDD